MRPRRFKSRDRALRGIQRHEIHACRWLAEDCTGCTLCVEVCPAKNKTEVKLKAINMKPQPPLRAAERKELGFLPGLARGRAPQLNTSMVKDIQLMQPLFEFSGACAGCGETPY